MIDKHYYRRHRRQTRRSAGSRCWMSCYLNARDLGIMRCLMAVYLNQQFGWTIAKGASWENIPNVVFQFFAVTVKISELIVCVLGVFAVVGLQRMRPWGRWLAIALAVVGVASAIRFYSAVLFFGLWTLVPHHVWPNVKSTIQLGFGIYIVWYLLQPKARLAFRPLPTSSTGQSEPNL